MGLSRLDNFLKSVRGTILYVDPNSLDSTDSIENQGNSLTRPFKTIQRALIEASRFSYQRGLNNDRFGKTTILVYPGDHIVDNRPGWIPDGTNNYKLRNGTSSNDFPPFDSTTSFDLTDPNNSLYKLNSIHGGVIIPRGTSLIGMDLRKTKIRPKYVPNPENDNIENSAIFRITGGCYFWQFSIFDADPNGLCYVDYTDNLFVPNFSHHKLTAFEYVDGVNNVTIQDVFYQNRLNYDRTDLDMYYEKVGIAYGASSGRAIEPDYPSDSLDIEPKIDEYRIVGSTGISVGITSIRSGNGVVSSNKIRVTAVNPIPGLEVDTPIRIEGISADGYNGQFVISEKLDDRTIVYTVQNSPAVALPSPAGSILSLSSDTVTSASPYIFNISMRSVYGMCGVLADGDKAGGFKSMVIAQFTGIGLQKDDKAFVIYNPDTGLYEDNTIVGNETLSSNSRSVFKPKYKNYHIKCINDAFIQNVSIFAIGYAEHFSSESGGDMSITNSNSNFGAKSLVSSGFRRNAFPRDDFGYITHIIPPKEFPIDEYSVEFASLDVATTIGIGTTTERLYLYSQTDQDVLPEHVIEGFRIGAKENDYLNLTISQNGITDQYISRIVMSNSQTSSEKSFRVSRSIAGINSIGQYSTTSQENVITLQQIHTFENGETVRVISDNGQLPDGLSPNSVYYVITNANASSGLTTTRNIKLANTLNDAKNSNEISINNIGGSLTIVSRVSDKKPGDIGHPIQWDTSQNQWYIKVATASTDNTIRSAFSALGTPILGNVTPRTFITRKKDNRNSSDRIYRFRYVIPSDTNNSYGKPPTDGFVIQESNTSIGSTDGEIQTYFGSGSLSNINQQRNFRFISNANWSGNSANILTELPHNLLVGTQVELVNIESGYNPTGAAQTGFNRLYTVTGVTSSREFVVGLNTDPGAFLNDINVRNTSLPYFKKKKYLTTYFIQQTKEVQKYITGEQDGIYHITVLNASNSPVVNPFFDDNYAQPVKNLYPQLNRDNPVSDPTETNSFASSSLIGEVVVNDVKSSITKETINKLLKDVNIGIGVTNIISTTNTSHDIFTSVDHGFNRITKVGIAKTGTGYVPGTYHNAKLIGFVGSPSGLHATAKVTIDSYGSISNVIIMHGGSSYGIGNTLSVVGIPTITGHSVGVVSVTKIYDNVGDVIKISGISSNSYSAYNDLYRIVNVKVGAAKSFVTESAYSVVGAAITTTGIGNTISSGSFAYLTGKAVAISSVRYTPSTGIATIVTSNYHGFNIENKIRLAGSDASLYNGDFVITSNVGLTSFTVNVGIRTLSPNVTTLGYVYPRGIASNDGIVSSDNENIGGRMAYTYAGITTSLYFEISDSTTDNVTIRGIQNLDIRIGDYLQIDNEIVRVKTTVSQTIAEGDPIYVFRGAFGTIAASHRINSTVKRIFVNPVELRRNSIIRASGHTFEYVGFGPGNYSTAFPDKQDRLISAQEELLAQSTRKDGGVNFYTGMNDKGISYSGNKKLSTINGQEEIFDTPFQTVTGEDISNESAINITSAIEGNFTRSIRVEGGSDGKAISEFNGPILINDKLTSTSPRGVEAVSLFLQGDASVSRKYTVGISTPSLAGNPGDVQYNASPTTGDYIGWVWTTNNQWERFGRIFPYSENTIGVSANNSYVGLASNLNFTGSGSVKVSGSYNSVGIATFTISADPSAIGLRREGSYLGVTTQIDLRTRNLDLTTQITPAGISTVTIVGLGTTESHRATQFIKIGATATNFLKAGGADSTLTSSEVTTALGFIPANSSSVSGEYPLGNSVVLDSIDQSINGGPFNGSRTDFTMKINGNAFIPAGNSANLLVSIGGVIQKPGTDYTIVQTAGANTSTIRFATAPQTGKSHFIVALGGQGALLSDLAWNNKGELVAAVGDNTAAIVGPGADGTFFTADSTVGVGVTWKTLYDVTTTSTGKTLTNREFCNVTANSITISLPSTPQTGWFVLIGNTGSFTNITVGRNGSNIMGLAEDMILDFEYASVGFMFVNASLGWRLI
jgi:hypothetical protein